MNLFDPPSVAEIRAHLDQLDASGELAFVQEQLAASGRLPYVRMQLAHMEGLSAKKRPTPANMPARPVRPGQSPRPPMPAQPRRTPPKKRALTEVDGQLALKKLAELKDRLLAELARPAPAAIERPRERVYLTRMERLTQPARDVEGITKTLSDTRVPKRMAAESTTLAQTFAPREW